MLGVIFSFALYGAFIWLCGHFVYMIIKAAVREGIRESGLLDVCAQRNFRQNDGSCGHIEPERQSED